jgi:transposase
MTLTCPATAVVVDVSTKQIIAKRSLKQLLGERYHLFTQQQKQKHRLAHERKNRQTKHQPIQAVESKLGQQIDRILAKAIVELAVSYNAGSIVLPVLTDIKNCLHAEINAKAEAKAPGCLEAQKAYAKQYRTSVNSWSYGRLQNCIAGKAYQNEIEIEYIKLPVYKSPSIMAGEMAFTAYKSRQVH